MNSELFVGLMSGTSMDAVDAVLVRFVDDRPQCLARRATPLPQDLRDALLALAHPGADEIDRAMQLDARLARTFATAVRAVLDDAGIAARKVRAIGSHGQTIRHAPQAAEPYTVQIANPALLAELTGITVVADFRRRDMAAGGQGAPLAPAFHAAFFRRADADVAVVNIGGIANLTVLPCDPADAVRGFDTGPGNGLLDAWTQRYLGVPVDRDGAWAAGGDVDRDLLACLLADPYFAQEPPKSTGREYFHLDWLDRHLARLGAPRAPRDVAATLVELTAQSIAAACLAQVPAAAEWLIGGGGVHNAHLMARLQAHAPVPLHPTTARGVDADDLEAIGFAWLARRTLLGLPGNLPEVTGARGPRVLGAIHPA